MKFTNGGRTPARETVADRYVSPNAPTGIRTETLGEVAARLGIALDEAPRSSRAVNKILAAMGHGEKLVAGRGYLYFVDGDASSWYSSSVGVCYMRDLTVRRWVQEHADLKNYSRNYFGE